MKTNSVIQAQTSDMMIHRSFEGTLHSAWQWDPLAYASMVNYQALSRTQHSSLRAAVIMSEVWAWIILYCRQILSLSTSLSLSLYIYIYIVVVGSGGYFKQCPKNLRCSKEQYSTCIWRYWQHHPPSHAITFLYIPRIILTHLDQLSQLTYL